LGICLGLRLDLRLDFAIVPFPVSTARITVGARSLERSGKIRDRGLAFVKKVLALVKFWVANMSGKTVN
jgi:hypothetical protein